MEYLYGDYITEDNIDEHTGNIVLFGEKIMIGRDQRMSFHMLMTAMSSKYRKPQETVESDAIKLRYIWEPVQDRVVVSPLNKDDDKKFRKNMEKFAKLIKRAIT